jgi:DNA-binding transcriptional MerR regulator
VDLVFYSCPIVTLVCQPSAAKPQISLTSASQMTGVHPEMIRYYSRLGLIATQWDPIANDLALDGDALDEVLRIEHYRRNLGVQRRALHLICELHREAERQHIELAFLRNGFTPVRES